MMLDCDDKVRSRKSSHGCSVFCYAALIGVVAGFALNSEPSELSRWHEYASINIGMTQEQVVTMVDSSSKSQTGCGAHHAENRESVCRFEDPWRGYAIGFDPVTKLVNRKRFYFKPVPGFRIR